MEGSYRPNYAQIEYSMFCNSNDTSYNVSRNFKNGLFCIHNSIINYEIILEGNQPYSDKIFKIQKGWLKLSQIQEWEIHVRNCSKIRNTTLILSIYILNINICDKKTFIL